MKTFFELAAAHPFLDVFFVIVLLSVGGGILELAHILYPGRRY